jgi:hypoxanthine phosphoribosyltransferase
MDIAIDYCGFQVKEGFLIGYGLDYNEQYRYLPDIYILLR